MATFGSGVDRVTFSNISATTAVFTLRGGQYGVSCNATFGGGNVQLQKQSLDGVTYISVLTADPSGPTGFAEAGYVTVNLPSGTYRVAVTTATAVYVSIESVITA